MDLAIFRKILIKQSGLDENSISVVGVSGGPDSIALLNLMHGCGLPVIAAHFNHQLRDEADDDEAYVRQFAEHRSIQFEYAKKNIRSLAKQSKRSIEEQARISRYEFLFNIARKHHAKYVAVGHNADDQVETVLMHLLRGSGLAGLCGMSSVVEQSEWGSDVTLIRPLLSFWRSEIIEYCRAEHLEPVYDLSNDESIYHRNRIRHELIPVLTTYNPQIKMRIREMAEILQGEKEINEASTQEIFNLVMTANEPQTLVINGSDFSLQTKGMQRALLRMAIGNLLPDQRDFDFKLIERARNFISDGRNGTTGLIKNLILEREGEDLVFKEAGDQKPLAKIPQIEKAIIIEKEEAKITLNAFWVLKIAADIADKKKPNKIDNPYQVEMDIDQINFPLVIRMQSPGDRFYPLGMKGHSIKLSDYWINRKLPLKYRRHYPLICDQDEIIWIPGFQPCEKAQKTAHTQRILHFSVTKRAHKD